MKRYKVWRHWIAAWCIAALTACGGGGSGGEVTSPGDGGNPPDAIGTQARIEATNRIAEKFEELVAAKTAKPFEALGVWAQSQPEVAEAGAGDESVWVRFKDGRDFVYSDNWKETGRAPWPDEPDATEIGLPRPRAAAAEIPKENRAVLLAFNGEEFQYGASVMRRVGRMLKDRGWTVEPVAELTAESLMNKPKIGLLYYTSHSALFGPTGKKEFSIMLSTQATLELDKTYKPELDAGRMIWHRDRTDWNRYGPRSAPRYAITSKFVRQYMSFSDNSLVVMLSCEAGLPLGAEVRQAFLDKGAGTLIAWEGNSNDNAHDSMHYMFDRLTGANKLEAPTPPNRAFAFDDVWAWMGKKVANDYPLLTTKGVDGAANARIIRIGGGFQMTNPILGEMEVSADDRLMLHGHFGAEAGTLSVGGVKLKVESWAEDLVTATLPTATDDPPGSFGDVVVTARERTSTKRVLTSWRGFVDYTYDLWPLNSGTGLLTNHLKVDLHVRGDAHELRAEVDGPLKRSTRLFVPASDTKVRYSGEGTNTNGLATTTWSGGGELPFLGGEFRNPSLGGFGTIDSVAREIKFLPVLANAPDMLTVIYNGTAKPIPMNFRTDTLGITAPYGGDTISLGTAFRLGADRNVAGYDRRIKSGAQTGSSEWSRVQTSGMYTQPAFDDKVAR